MLRIKPPIARALQILPRIKVDESIAFDLPEGELTDSDDIALTAEKIVKLVASGQLPIREGQQLAALIEEQQQKIKTERRSFKHDLFSP